MPRTSAPAALTCLLLASLLTSTAAPAAEPPLRVGVLTDMAGQFSDEAGQGSVTAVRMAVEDFGGTVLGRSVEVIVADHQNKSENGSAIASEWFERQNVGMVVNLINSAVALAVAKVAQTKDRIAIVTGAGSSRLTNEGCTPNSIHYAYNTYALASGTVSTLTARGDRSWFMLTADYAFGQALEADTRDVLKRDGGEVVGAVRYPVSTLDLASFLFQAQGSGAKVMAFAGSGTTFVNAVKSAQEFGLGAAGGQRLVGLLVWLSDVKALGLEVAQGLILTNAWYWDRDDETRAFSKRFEARMGRPPQMGDAADYSATLHYLNAVKAAGTDAASSVMAKMREMPVDDVFAHGGTIRIDGQMVHDMYVYEVKTPAESKGAWDFYKPLRVIPAAQAFRPLSESKCSLAQKP